MKPEVFTLTADQALDELAAIMDARPGDEDPLGVINWQKANSARAKELEAWILMKQGHPKDLPEAAPMEVAPPHHLQPEPPKASAPTKEKAMPAKKTPKEKLQSLVDSYHVLVDKLQDDPTNRRFRDDASTCKSRMSNLERDFHLTHPELRPIPSIKMGRPAGGPVSKPKASPVVDQVLDCFVPELPAAPEAQDLPEAAAPVEIHMHTSKAGPGPYVPPTAAEIQELIAFLPHHRALVEPTTTPQPLPVRDALRRIRRDFIRVLVDLEDLGFNERRTLGEDLQRLDNLVQTAVILVGEPSISKAG